MNILDRYIIKTMTVYTLAVMVIWISVYSFFNFLEELKQIGNVDYGVFDAILYIVINIPSVLYAHSLVIILLGTLLALGHLASTSQLIIIRSFGISIMQIAKIVIKAALLFMLVAVIIGEFIAPSSVKLAENIRANALGQITKLHSEQGLWLKDGLFIIKIGKNLDGKNFKNVVLLKRNKNSKLDTIIKANDAFVSNDFINFKNAIIYQIRANDELSTISKTKKDKYSVKISFNKDLLDSLKKYPYELSSYELLKQIYFSSLNNISATIYEVEFYKRIIRPVTLVAMILTAMLFIFGSLRDSSLGRNIFLGLMLALVFELTSKIGGALSLRYEISPFLSSSLLSFIVLFLSFFLLKKKSQT